MKLLFLAVTACAVTMSSFVGHAEVAVAKDAKGTVVKKLSKDDATVFVRLTVQRTARFDELAIFQRVLVEKQAELKETLAKLEGEHGMDPKKSYSYETATRKLFELVPAKKEGGEPTKKEVTTFKDAEAAAPLAREMIARKLVENQLAVLGQLSREKAQEAELVDSKLRKMFKLDADGIYSFNADDSTIYRTGTKAKAKEKAKAEGQAQEKKSKK